MCGATRRGSQDLGVGFKSAILRVSSKRTPSPKESRKDGVSKAKALGGHALEKARAYARFYLQLCSFG